MAKAPQSPEDTPPAAELRPPARHRAAQTEGGVPAVPGKDLSIDLVSKMVSEIGTVPGISRVMYDLTSKPPGTTEWE